MIASQFKSSFDVLTCRSLTEPPTEVRTLTSGAVKGGAFTAVNDSAFRVQEVKLENLKIRNNYDKYAYFHFSRRDIL